MALAKIFDANRNVQKIVIQSYNDKKMTDHKGRSPFTIPVNPESFSQKFEIKLEQNQGTGNQGGSPKYAATPPEELKMDFILDNTNTIEGNILQNTPIPDQVHMLLDTVYNMEGKMHRPPYLKVVWNEQAIFGTNKTSFDCQLKSLDIQYVLFNNKGEPLRAKISAVFSGFIEDEKRVFTEGKSSPDLTHVRTITPADRFWLMTNEIYGETSPLLQVTQANNLTTFRHLPSGSKVIFPPYDRTEA